MPPVILTSINEPHPFPAFHIVSAPIHLVLVQQNCRAYVRVKYDVEIHHLLDSPMTRLQE